MTSEEPVKETWSSHLKEFAKKNDMTYRVAMSNPDAKLAWAKKRVPKPKKEKVVKPKKEKVVKAEKVVKEKVVKPVSTKRLSNKAKKEAHLKKEALEKLK